MKVRRRLWGGGAEENDPKKYSVKYLGPEKAAAVLEKALQSVKVYMPCKVYTVNPTNLSNFSAQDLQGKSGLWKFTQRLEVSTVPAF